MEIKMKSALLILDLQNEMVDKNGKIGAHGLAAIVAENNILENAATAIAASRAAGNDVIYVRLGWRHDYSDCLSTAPRINGLKTNKAAIAGEWGCEFPEIITPEENDLVITKQAVNPFFNTGLMTWLMHRGIKKLYLGGVATNLVVESTVRFADDAGFTPVVIRELCAAPNPEWHKFSIDNIIPVFGSVITLHQFKSEIAKG